MEEERYATRLQALVDDYYHGATTFAAYRQERTRLLDRLEADERPAAAPIAAAAERPVEVAASVHAPKSAPVFADHRDILASFPIDEPSARECVIEDDEKPRPRVLRRVMIIAIALGLGLATMVDLREPVESSAIADNSAAVGMLARFLTRGDWADESLSNFRLAWISLPTSERELVRASPEFRDFSTELLRRLEPAAAEQPELAELARVMQVPPANADSAVPQRTEGRALE